MIYSFYKKKFKSICLSAELSKSILSTYLYHTFHIFFENYFVLLILFGSSLWGFLQVAAHGQFLRGSIFNSPSKMYMIYLPTIPPLWMFLKQKLLYFQLVYFIKIKLLRYSTNELVWQENNNPMAKFIPSGICWWREGDSCRLSTFRLSWNVILRPHLPYCAINFLTKKTIITEWNWNWKLHYHIKRLRLQDFSSTVKI